MPTARPDTATIASGADLWAGRDAPVSSSPAEQVTPLQVAGSGTMPWTVGQLFAKGDVPAGAAITLGCAQHQADIRNRWSDGSVRFAVLSGVSAAGAVAVNRGGTPYSAANVAEPSVPAVVTLTAVTDAAAGTVAGGTLTADIATARTAGALAWDRTVAHKAREILGPVMSEFHYYVPTADAHTHVWFFVRAYLTGDVEVETVVENGWTLVASPGQRNYHASVSIGGSERYNSGGVTKLQHFHHTRWRRVDWAGTDPAATVTHDVAYLQGTKLLPAYADITLAETAYTTVPSADGARTISSYTSAESALQEAPFAQHGVSASMGSGGDKEAYGPVPSWVGTYLIDADPRALRCTMGNGSAAMRYSVHYRSETDGRPWRATSRATLSLNSTNSGISERTGSNESDLTPAPDGSVAASWYTTHSPASAFSAYLVGGRWVDLEEQQFQAGFNVLGSYASYSGVRSVPWWGQNRMQAWMFRDLIQSRLVTPTQLRGIDVSGAEADQATNASVLAGATIAQWYDYYVSGSSTATPTQARGNVFGLPYQNADFDFNGGSNADGEIAYGGLQNGFYITSVLYAFDCEPDVEAGKLESLAAFHAKFPVGLLGAATDGEDWDWRLSTFVNMGGFATPGATTPGGDSGTGNTYRASWNAAWAAVTASSAMNWLSGTFPFAADNYIRKGQTDGTNYVASVKTAIVDDTDTRALWWAAAYAHKAAERVAVNGADLAYRRLLGSDTWANTKAARMTVRPDYGIVSGRPSSALATAAEALSAGSIVELAAPSLLASDSTGSRPWLPPAASGSTTGTLDWCSNLPYCPVTGRVIACGGRPADTAAANKLIYYDLMADEWDGVANPFGTGGGHLYQSQCLSVEHRRFFFLPIFGSRVIQVWGTDDWQALSPLAAIPGFTAGASAWGDAIALMWHPNLGAQGTLIAAGGDATRSRIAFFDWDTQAWSEEYFASGSGSLREGHNAAIYVPAADACIVGKSSVANNRQLFKIDNAGTITEIATYTGTVSAFNGHGILTPHPTRAAAIHFCPATNKVWSYEFASDEWVDRGAIPSQLDHLYQAGATIPELGVVFVVSGLSVEAAGSKTYVYKPDF